MEAIYRSGLNIKFINKYEWATSSLPSVVLHVRTHINVYHLGYEFPKSGFIYYIL
jgi:hypothetical protein